MSTGYYDAHGIWHYGEDDLLAPGGEFSALLNKLADSLPDGIDSMLDAKILELEADPNDAIVKALVLDDSTPSETRTALDAVVALGVADYLDNLPILRMGRSAATPTVQSSDWTNVAATANWIEQQRVGFAAYANGVTIPATGIYRVTHALAAVAAGNGIVGGISINKSTTPFYTDLRAFGGGMAVGGLNAYTSTAVLALTAGDVLRVHGLANTGTFTLAASLGQLVVERIR